MMHPCRTRPSVSAPTAFRLGFLTNITNPKSALFGSVFAASFPASPSILLQASAVVMIVLNALCWHTLLASPVLTRPGAAGLLREPEKPPTVWHRLRWALWGWGC